MAPQGLIEVQKHEDLQVTVQQHLWATLHCVLPTDVSLSPGETFHRLQVPAVSRETDKTQHNWA